MHKTKKGFSLAEVMIALGIIATIAVFAIPKFRSTADTKMSKEKVKQVVSDVVAAYQKYKSENAPSTEFRFRELTPYLNYTSITTTGALDRRKNQTGSVPCSSINQPCYNFPNGAAAWGWDGATNNNGTEFGDTASNRYIVFWVDPDGEAKDATASDSATKGIEFALYYDGKVRTLAECREGDLTVANETLYDWCPGTPSSTDVAWWSWD